MKSSGIAIGRRETGRTPASASDELPAKGRGNDMVVLLRELQPLFIEEPEFMTSHEPNSGKRLGKR